MEKQPGKRQNGAMGRGRNGKNMAKREVPGGNPSLARRRAILTRVVITRDTVAWVWPGEFQPSELKRNTFKPRARLAGFSLRETTVRRIVSDMKTLTMRELNRKTAGVLDALERGETFELRRNGRAVGYLTQTPPLPERKPDWTAHFEWLKQQRGKGGGFVEELEEDRRRLRAREAAMEELG